jgi:small subunit ribosomal protein S18
MADKPVKVREDIDGNIDINGDEVSVAPIEEKRPLRKSAPPRYAGPQQQRSGNRSNYDSEGGRSGGNFNRRGGYFPGRRRVCPIKIEEVNWKNLDSLRYFVSDDGGIRPRRKTGANAKLQRKVAVAVKRARHMALLPYTGEHIRISGSRR